MSKKRVIEDGKILFYQNSTNEIIDLGDELSLNEIGYYLIIKNIYIKYFGNLTVKKIPKYAKIFKKSEQKRIKNFAKRFFNCPSFDTKIVNKDWDLKIQKIIAKSGKSKEAADIRWGKNDENNDANAYANAYANGDANININTNINTNININTIKLNFQKFFEKYPLKKNKIKTYNIFIELFENEEKPDALFKEIMEGLERYNQEIRTTNKKKEYIMQPNNWLANERWKDEYVEYVDCNNINVDDKESPF